MLRAWSGITGWRFESSSAHKERARTGGLFLCGRSWQPTLGEDRAENAVGNRNGHECRNSARPKLEAKTASVQAQLEDRDGGVYKDPSTGRWFIVMRPPGAAKTTTRRRAPDGRRLTTRDQGLVARGQWEAQMASGAVVVGRERFENFWPRYVRHARAEMTKGSWEDVRAHGTKRLLPFFSGMQMSQIVVDTVREWRAVMHEAVEAGEYAPKTINNARIALLGCCRMAVADRLMAHNPVLDVKPLPIEFTERPYLRLCQINRYIDACPMHYG